MDLKRRSGWPVLVVLASLIGVVTTCSSEERADLGPVGTLGPSEALASVGPLREAVQQSAERLLDAPGIEFTQVDYREGELVGSLWGESRANGDFVHIDFTKSRPTGTSSQVATSARLRFEETTYVARSSSNGDHEPWMAVDSITSSPSTGNTGLVGVPLAELSEGSLFFDPEDYPSAEQEAIRAETAGGGYRWTLTISRAESSIVQRWHVDASGRLRYHSVHVDDAPEIGMRSIEIAFTPLEDPAPIAQPPVGFYLDLANYDIPSDLPLT